MLPYTPLHYLLFAPPHLEPSQAPAGPEKPLQVLVMTSGNLSEEPIATSNQEARRRLSTLGDAFLMHNRPIYVRCDDSVVRVFESGRDRSHQISAGSPGIKPGKGGLPGPEGSALIPLRRSRGYAPFPVRLPWEAVPLLAAGAELKNTFCITQNRYAFLSHHIGDLENYETLESFESGAAHFERLFRVHPQALAYDLHPNYLSSRYVLDRSGKEALPSIGVQHHHAHIAACLAEHEFSGEEPVIGVAFDGTGYGEDGSIWGGEFLLAGYENFERRAHLAYVPLPGGDAAIRRPARTALAYLWQADLDWQTGLPCVDDLCVEERAALRSQLEHGLNAPLTSSMGRLFDAAAALIGVRQKVNYEAQAAIELEALNDPCETGLYPFEIRPPNGEDRPILIDPAPLLHSLLAAVLAGEPAPILAARFHNGIAAMVQEVCELLRTESGVSTVALSGGVWQNLTLLRKTKTLLDQAGFDVLIHSQVPANDGGIALGQAAVAVHRLIQ
jgi:hydrogenase maturation protein HypF